MNPLRPLCRLGPLRPLRRQPTNGLNGPNGLNGRGQSLVEYAVLIAAVTAALVIMSDYVRRAFNAHAESIEEELNGATE